MKNSRVEINLWWGGTARVYICGCVEFVGASQTEDGFIINSDDVAKILRAYKKLAVEPPADTHVSAGDDERWFYANGDDIMETT